MKQRAVSVDEETYSRLREFSSRLGLSISSTLRLLVNVLDVEETEDEVVVLLDTSSPFRARRIRVVDSRKYRSMLAELRRLCKVNVRLESELERLRSECEMLRRINESLRKLAGDRRAEDVLKLREPGIVEELRKHGLLELAKRWLICGDRRLEDYVNEDALFSIIAHRDEILASESERKVEPRELTWIL